MTPEELTDFVKHGMSLSHVYQPVMLIELLQSNKPLEPAEPWVSMENTGDW